MQVILINNNNDQLRRIDENLHLFIQPGEVVLKEREPASTDYLYKCYAHGYEKIENKPVCEDMMQVLPKASICYYYRTSMYDSCRYFDWY